MKRLVQALAGVAISAAALWLTLRGKDLGGIWQAMRSADYRALVPYLAILVAIHFARTIRWGILLEPVARIPFARLNAASAVGFMALVLLPFRLGELGRPVLVAERPGLRVSAALSSIVVERVADGLFTGLMLLASVLAIPDGVPGVHVVRVAGVAVSMAFGALLVFLVIAYRSRELAVRITERTVGALSPRLAARVSGMMDAFIHGLRLVPSRRKVVAFFALTVAYWGLNAWGMRILARGFGLELLPLQACTVLGVLVGGAMIPAGPGMVGTFQGAVVLGLALFFPRAVVDTRGTAYANVLWASQIGQQVLFGLVFMFSRHVQPARLWGAPHELEEGLEAEEAEYRAGEAAAAVERQRGDRG